MVRPAATKLAVTAFRSGMQRVRNAAERSSRNPGGVRVVAVSETKPVSLIRQVYLAGHRCFGENHVQELIDKAPRLPKDIEWHFTGPLQSNKLQSLLASAPNLAMVEGVDPPRCVELTKHVKLSCPNLEFGGLMTLGMPDYTFTPQNFKTLSDSRIGVCKALGMPERQCELSMGMSDDFEQAIEMGSINVRIGSTIFGPKNYIETTKNVCLGVMTEEEKRVLAVESILKYTFRKPELLNKALTHPSSLGNAGSSSSYRRMQFLGDAALGLAFTNFMYLKYPDLDQGSLTLLRSVNVSNDKLARIAVRHRIHQFVRHDLTDLQHKVNEFIVEEDSGAAVKAPKALADMVEAIAAAVYIDCEYDIEAFWKVFKDFLEPIITWEILQNNNNQ